VVVASKVGNDHSEFGHARPSGSRVIRYVCDGRTDGRTKAKLTVPFPTGGGHNKTNVRVEIYSNNNNNNNRISIPPLVVTSEAVGNRRSNV